MQSSSENTRIGIVGAGHLGRFHIECIQKIDGFELTGFYDKDPERSELISEKYGIPLYDHYDRLLEETEAICIVTPTSTHYEIGKQAIEAGKHLFIEKPLTSDPVSSRTLAQLLKEKGLVGRVGHIERYNPAFLSANNFGLHEPVFIEAHRLAPFNPRGLDVPVVLDLMIHDIDIVLSIIQSEVDHIEANGVGVAGKTADICNARITFRNKAVANLTASRISLKQMRKLRLFQRDQYMAIDFLNHEVQVVKLLHEEPSDLISMKMDLPDGTRWIAADSPEIQKHNALELELREFLQAIRHSSEKGVTFEEGAKAVEVAHQIMEQITPYEI